jgi:sugar O-acyltransferase (sialic acid O-acetyltransferase NeuD family)
MNKRLIIVGAGGHGRVASDIASLVGYSDICYLDDSDISGMNVIGKVSDFVKYVREADFFVAIGNNKTRERLYNEMKSSGADIVSLVHPAAVIAPSVKIGSGSIIMAGAVVNNGALLGTGVIVNTCSSVDHDCIIEDFSHISVGAHLAGTVSIGKRAFICAGATVINNVSVCDDSVIGAGAVVISNINERGTYVGVPARKL